jgi:hypothetical protein
MRYGRILRSVQVKNEKKRSSRVVSTTVLQLRNSHTCSHLFDTTLAYIEHNDEKGIFILHQTDDAGM